MSVLSFLKVSGPSVDKVPQDQVQTEYKRIRNKTFWGATVAYSLYYLCRLSLSVSKQPLIDGGFLTAGQLGVIGSALFFVYAFGKFLNGFIADYCNIRRFMATGLILSTVINLLMGVLGFAANAHLITNAILFTAFAVLWGINGWAQSMGAAPGVISLSRWFPLSSRGTYYSIFSSTPYIGEFISFIITGFVVSALGWQWGFVVSSLAGLIGFAVILIFVSDNPQSKGLPTIQEISGEITTKEDTMSIGELQKKVFRHPGIWIIALSSAFIYVTKYAVAGWGILFLQKSKEFSLESASQVIAFSSAFGILGTILAGWLSDNLFKGDRAKPALLSGILGFLSLGLFLFGGGGQILNTVYISIFSLSTGVLYCIVAGLMAIDFVPRKATGAALGIVGISSYVAAGIQDIVSGYMIQGNSAETLYDFTPVSIFWMAAALLAFVLPVVNWTKLRK